MDDGTPDDPNTGTPQKRPALKRCRPEDRLSDKRLRELRALSSGARVRTLVDIIYRGYEVLVNSEDEKYQLAAIRVLGTLLESHRKEDQHVGAGAADLAEAHADLLAEFEALKRGTGPTSGTFSEGDEEDKPVH